MVRIHVPNSNQSEMLDTKTQQKKVCAFYSSQGGCRNGKKCPFEHVNNVKKEVCKYFNSPSGCKYGDKYDFEIFSFNRCFFQHVKPDVNDVEQQQYHNFIQQQYLAQQQYYMSLQGTNQLPIQGEVYDSSEIEKQFSGKK
jgi:hypothetical protein